MQQQQVDHSLLMTLRMSRLHSDLALEYMCIQAPLQMPTRTKIGGNG